MSVLALTRCRRRLSPLSGTGQMNFATLVAALTSATALSTGSLGKFDGSAIAPVAPPPAATSTDKDDE